MARFKLLTRPARRRRSVRREVKAELRELLALLRQFWKPLLAFFAVIVGGALLYILLTPPGEERMFFGEAVYYMMDLMIFAVDPGDFPADLPRQVFFFMMPVLGVSAMISGVVSFGAALLNRSNRQHEWEVALASTYNHHVVVCGVGHLGTRVVRHLLDLKFDVVVIENNPEASGVEEIRTYNIPLLLKDASSPEALVEAGIERADTLLICTDDDMANMVVTMRARELNPGLRIVVRMFDESLGEQLRNKLGADDVYSGSMLAAPVFASAATHAEVAQRFTVGEQMFSMVRLEICEGSPLAGQTIAEIERPQQLDIVLHIGATEAVPHPNPDTVVRAGDEIVVFAPESLLREITQRNRMPGC